MIAINAALRMRALHMHVQLLEIARTHGRQLLVRYSTNSIQCVLNVYETVVKRPQWSASLRLLKCRAGVWQ